MDAILNEYPVEYVPRRTTGKTTVNGHRLLLGHCSDDVSCLPCTLSFGSAAVIAILLRQNAVFFRFGDGIEIDIKKLLDDTLVPILLIHEGLSSEDVRDHQAL